MPAQLLIISYLLTITCIVAIAVYSFYSFFSTKETNIYKQAMNMATEGKYLDARAMLREHLKKNPKNPLVHFYIAQIYNMQGNLAEELNHIKQLKNINIFPPPLNPVEIFLQTATTCYEENELASAFENFLNVLQYDPNHEVALAHIAFLAIGQENFRIAEKYFSRLVKLVPQVKEYHIGRGIGLEMLKSNYSITEFSQALDIDSNDQTALFLKSLACFHQRRTQEAQNDIEKLINIENLDVHIRYIAHKLAVVIYYLENNLAKAINYAEVCVTLSTQNEWYTKEKYDAYLSLALLSLIRKNLPRTIECLLEMEDLNPGDVLVNQLSIFRQDLEDGNASFDEPGENGFHFNAYMQDWLRDRFSEHMAYDLSGLAENTKFEVPDFFPAENDGSRKDKLVETEDSDDEYEKLIDRFCTLNKQKFEDTCQKIVNTMDFTIIKDMNYRPNDGMDYICKHTQDKNTKALFRIRQWNNQPISDIFLREQQDIMNKETVQLGFIIAGTELTYGAEKALEKLNNITVIYKKQFANLIKKVMPY